MSASPQELAARALNRGHKSIATIDGSKTAFWTYPSSTPSAKKIVLIHGYRGNHHGLEAIAGALEDFEIIIPDLPGFGESEPLRKSHNVENYASWLTAFLATQATDSSAVLGHSFGSIIVSAAAAAGVRQPLILVNPVSVFRNRGAKSLIRGSVGFFYWLGGVLPDGLGTAALKSPAMVRAMSEVLTKTRNSALRIWIHKQHRENFSVFANRRVAIEGYWASSGQGVASYARSISQPVLMITGEFDDITSAADQTRTKSLFPQSELAEINDVGHLIHYETPEQASSLVRGFINRLPSNR